MTIQEIKAQCESLSNEELLLIVNNKIRYTEVIVGVAQQEIKKRGITKEEFKVFRKDQSQITRIIEGDIHEDLLLFEKIAFYFTWFFRPHYFVIRDYTKRKYNLKVRQAWFYLATGAAIFMIFLVAGSFLFSLKVAMIIWAACFPIVFVFNRVYFKPRTIRRLAG